MLHGCLYVLEKLVIFLFLSRQDWTSDSKKRGRQAFAGFAPQQFKERKAI
jgi:hypothetical protein